MSKELLPLSVGDISAFARSLRRQLEDRGQLPSHLEMLNMLAKAGGFGNFQHFRAAVSVEAQPENTAYADSSALPPNTTDVTHRTDMPDTATTASVTSGTDHTMVQAGTNASEEPPLSQKRLRRLAGYFDTQGRLTRWPPKYTQRLSCLWVMWSRMTARTAYSEVQVNELLLQNHLFGDHALLRREMVDNGMLRRTPDGRRYERVELAPTAEAIALMARLRETMRETN